MAASVSRDVEDQAQDFADLCEGGRTDVAEAVLDTASGHRSDVLALGRGAVIEAVGGIGVDLNVEDFANITEAKAVLEDWRVEYNHYRPHQSLGGLTPAAYASHWKQHQHP